MLPRGSWFGVLAFIALLAGIISAPTAPAQQGPLPKALTPEDLASRTFYRRAVDAVIWGLPLVGEDAVKQAAFPRRQGKLQRHRLVAQR